MSRREPYIRDITVAEVKTQLDKKEDKLDLCS